MKRFLHWRKMTWAIVLWTGLMGAWLVISALTAANVALDCATDSAGVAASALTQRECVDSAGLGSAARAVVTGALWLTGVGVLTVIWFMTRPLWRQGHGARLRRMRPEQIPWLYDEATVFRSTKTEPSA